MVNAHEHISGRPRAYISRKWFHRGRHRPAVHRQSVDELTEWLNKELAEKHRTGFHMSADGKHFVWQGHVKVGSSWTGPDTESFVMLVDPPSGEVANIRLVPTVDDGRSKGLFGSLEGGPW